MLKKCVSLLILCSFFLASNSVNAQSVSNNKNDEVLATVVNIQNIQNFYKNPRILGGTLLVLGAGSILFSLKVSGKISKVTEYIDFHLTHEAKIIWDGGKGPKTSWNKLTPDKLEELLLPGDNHFTVNERAYGNTVLVESKAAADVYKASRLNMLKMYRAGGYLLGAAFLATSLYFIVSEPEISVTEAMLKQQNLDLAVNYDLSNFNPNDGSTVPNPLRATLQGNEEICNTINTFGPLAAAIQEEVQKI